MELFLHLSKSLPLPALPLPDCPISPPLPPCTPCPPQPHQVRGAQEEVQLREQDFGNFQDLIGREKLAEERLRFSRFFYRFPNGACTRGGETGRALVSKSVGEGGTRGWGGRALSSRLFGSHPSGSMASPPLTPCVPFTFPDPGKSGRVISPQPSS